MTEWSCDWNIDQQNDYNGDDKKVRLLFLPQRTRLWRDLMRRPGQRWEKCLHFFVLWSLHNIRDIFLSKWHWEGYIFITYYKLYIIVMQYWLNNRKLISALRRVLRPLHPPLPHSQARHLFRCYPGCHVYKEIQKKIQVVLKKKPHKCRFLWWLSCVFLQLAWRLDFYVQFPGPSFCHQCWRQAGKGSKYFLINLRSALLNFLNQLF